MSSDPGAHRREDCDAFGARYEQHCFNFFKRHGCHTAWPTKQQNMIDKIDLFVDGQGVDVKSCKPGGLFIEYKGITGHPGWLQGKAVFFAFYLSKSEFHLIRRQPFFTFLSSPSVCGFPPRQPKIGRAADFPAYTWFQRTDRKDVIAWTPGLIEKFENYAQRAAGGDWWIIKLS